MTERIRFHLDEHINPIIAVALRRYGIDVTTTVEAQLRTRDDNAQLAFAKQESRVLVTHDDDFLRMARQTLDHAGIAYCHKEARSVGEMIQMLRLIYEALSSAEMHGRVEYL